jgi:hypothetical protein
MALSSQGKEPPQNPGRFTRAGRVGVKQHLEAVAVGERESFKNSWKTALYQALAKSDWYIDGGYLLE